MTSLDELPQSIAMPSLAARAWPASLGDTAELKALYLLRCHALEQFSEVLTSAKASALLVKGAALASTHYPLPWARPMGDIDVLVKRSELQKLRAGLSRAGWSMASTSERPLTEECLEIAVQSPGAYGSVLLEMHLGLDKVVVRRTDVSQLFSRATGLANLPGLYVPDAVDQLLLVVLHLASDEFRHLTGFVDLEVLLSAGVDLEVVVARARHWRATTPLYIALKTLEALRPGLVPPAALERLEPSAIHSALLSTSFDIGSWPVARSATELGWKWITRQTLLRDDTAHWLVGLGSYGARRVLERTRQCWGLFSLTLCLATSALIAFLVARFVRS